MPCPICAECEGIYPGPARSGVFFLEDESDMPYTSDKRLYLNPDRSKVVEEDSLDAAYLLVGEGGEVSDEDVKKYGLSKQAKAAAEAESKDAPKDAESKQVAEPPENKSRSARSDKGD